MRLLSYNILEGLRPIDPPPTERRALDRTRLAAAQDVVRDRSPDVLVLNEALFCQHYAGRYVDYAEMFGLEHSAVALYDEAWGNAILSRFPIKRSWEVRTQDRGGLVSRIETPEGSLTVASYHPHPAREPALRARDFRRLVDGITGPTLVCGDFNCVNPADPIDVEGLCEAFHDFSIEPRETVQRFVEAGRHVFTALEALGLRDAVPLSGRAYTIPTDLLRADKRSAMRIDHVLCNDEVSVLAGGTLHSEAAERASDHYPVWLDFTLPETP